MQIHTRVTLNNLSKIAQYAVDLSERHETLHSGHHETLDQLCDTLAEKIVAQIEEIYEGANDDFMFAALDYVYKRADDLMQEQRQRARARIYMRRYNAAQRDAERARVAHMI